MQWQHREITDDIDDAQDDGLEGAKEICRNTPGPVASIFYQGLERSPEGLDMVEKSIAAYGSVQMGRLERNLMDFSIHRTCAYARIYGYCNRYDWSLTPLKE